MKPHHRVHAVGAATAVGAALILLTGCTTSPADNGTSTPTTTSPTATPRVINPDTMSPTPTTPSSPTPASPGSTSLDVAGDEATDRAEVEATWARFWSVTDNLWRLPEADRLSVASEVSVEPTLSQVIQQARQFTEEGVEAYGSPVFHPYWQQSIDGGELAVMGDCTDTSTTGSMYSATGQKKTVGVPDNNTRVTFVRGQDGKWRVEKIFYLLDVPCP